jgi:hypothetical protein
VFSEITREHTLLAGGYRKALYRGRIFSVARKKGGCEVRWFLEGNPFTYV